MSVTNEHAHKLFIRYAAELERNGGREFLRERNWEELNAIFRLCLRRAEKAGDDRVSGTWPRLQLRHLSAYAAEYHAACGRLFETGLRATMPLFKARRRWLRVQRDFHFRMRDEYLNFGETLTENILH